MTCQNWFRYSNETLLGSSMWLYVYCSQVRVLSKAMHLHNGVFVTSRFGYMLGSMVFFWSLIIKSKRMHVLLWGYLPTKIFNHNKIKQIRTKILIQRMILFAEFSYTKTFLPSWLWSYLNVMWYCKGFEMYLNIDITIPHMQICIINIRKHNAYICALKFVLNMLLHP